MNTEDRKTPIDSLSNVRTAPGHRQKPVLCIERLTAISDDALAILHEYYAAIHVIQQDQPGRLEELIGTTASGIWLAYLDREVVGCVVLRKLASLPHASECKRLYVKPSARGQRIADKLLDAQEAFARDQGIEWIYLDSYDALKAAIALYEKRGYQRCERYNDNPQATVFMRKQLV